MSAVSTTRQTIDGFEIATRETGSGPTVLFLHGAGGAGDLFAGDVPSPFIAELAKTFRVIVPEHPGFGTQDRPAWLDNIHDLAYFYLDYLKARRLDRVHLLGQSLGGWIALEMAVRDTSRLATLTVAGAAGIHLKGVAKGDVFMWTRDQFAKKMFRNPDAMAAFLARRLSPEEEVAFLRNRETFALLAWEPRLYDPHLAKWLHRIDVPTHVIWADDHAVLPKVYGEAIARHVNAARLSIIPDCGHLVHLDRPAAFSSAVAGFIREKAA